MKLGWKFNFLFYKMIFKVKIVKIKMSDFYKLFQNVLKVQFKKKIVGYMARDYSPDQILGHC